MRHVLVGSILLVGAGAAAQPPALKPPPVDAPIEVVRAMVHGEMLSARRAYRPAIAEYEKAERLAPSPATAFDLAVTYEYARRNAKAIAQYKLYLERAPAGPERAAVEKRLAELGHAPRPFELVVRSPGVLPSTIPDDEPDSYILVDGVRVGSSPVTVELDGRMHFFENISATTYATQAGRGEDGTWDNGEHRDLLPYVDPGNVIVRNGTNDHVELWTSNGAQFRANERTPMPAGHYVLYPPKACHPMAFDVKSTTELTYVRVIAPGDRTILLGQGSEEHGAGCVELALAVTTFPIPARVP